MKKTINFYEFARAFETAGRADQFSRYALSAIFDWMQDYEEETGEETELDVIAICCDWSEDSPENIADQYGIETSDDDGRELADRVLDSLHDNTSAAIGLPNGKIVYVQF